MRALLPILLALASAPLAAEVPAPGEMARGLAELGPRPVGSSAHDEAEALLLKWMQGAGLEGVEAQLHEGPAGERITNLTGFLPGESGVEIVLTAHYDSVPTSPGAADNAAGCAVLLQVAARLAELPRRHTLRVVLFDGEELGLLGARAWAGARTDEQRGAVLGVLNLDLVGWASGGSGAARVIPDPDSRIARPPAWLMHALARSGSAIGDPVAAASSRWSTLGQLISRAFVSPWLSDAEAMSAVDLPAVTLSDADLFTADPERHGPGDGAERLEEAALERWVARLMAASRRLDALAGRPREDDQYLVLLSRVWSRRDLYWVNLTVWIALVFVGLPGRWRGERSAERVRRGRSYLPGFASRVLYLGSLLMLPVFATVLLLPVAAISVVRTLLRLPPAVALALAALPWAVVLGASAYLATQGRLGTPALGLPALALLLASFASMIWQIAVPPVESSRA